MFSMLYYWNKYYPVHTINHSCKKHFLIELYMYYQCMYEQKLMKCHKLLLGLNHVKSYKEYLMSISIPQWKITAVHQQSSARVAGNWIESGSWRWILTAVASVTTGGKTVLLVFMWPGRQRSVLVVHDGTSQQIMKYPQASEPVWCALSI